jgi:hypothetical protein
VRAREEAAFKYLMESHFPETCSKTQSLIGAISKRDENYAASYSFDLATI